MTLALAAAAADLLLEHGPLTLTELHELARAQGLTKAKTTSGLKDSLSGELFPDYLALLLGAAADRVQLAAPRYDRYEPYAGSYSSLEGDVIRLDAWKR